MRKTFTVIFNLFRTLSMLPFYLFICFPSPPFLNQEKRVGFTLQARKIQMKNSKRDDSIQSETGSTDHQKGLRNLVKGN